MSFFIISKVYIPPHIYSWEYSGIAMLKIFPISHDPKQDYLQRLIPPVGVWEPLIFSHGSIITKHLDITKDFVKFLKQKPQTHNSIKVQEILDQEKIALDRANKFGAPLSKLGPVFTIKNPSAPYKFLDGFGCYNFAVMDDKYMITTYSHSHYKSKYEFGKNAFIWFLLSSFNRAIQTGKLEEVSAATGIFQAAVLKKLVNKWKRIRKRKKHLLVF